MGHFIPVHDVDGSACTDNRLKAHIESFKHATGITRPDYIVRAPGRINLIGDHIDYHGFSVLPMAIENSVLIGVSFSQIKKDVATENKTKGDIGNNSDHANQMQKSKRSKITILNSDPNKYPKFQGDHSFSYGSKLDQSHRWYHYILCGYHGVLAKELLALESSQIYKHSKSIVESDECVNLDAKKLNELSDLVLFVDSDLPPASGLSSSSALVCAAALATRLFLMKNKESAESTIDTQSLAEDCAKFEHLVGTAGGGMDQAVILTAEEGYAKHIEFEPTFKCTNVHLPDDVVWLVSHCGHECAKAATLDFNSRVLETKIGAAIISRKWNKVKHSHIPIDSSITLGRVMQAQGVSDHIPGSRFMIWALDIMQNVFKELVQPFDSMNLDKVCKLLKMNRAELIKKFGTSEDFLRKSQLDKIIKPHTRCQHVLDESTNVRYFVMECDGTEEKAVPSRLGYLMNRSHDSLRDKFECSHPLLDRLVETSRDAGALGARLTGAGWGGCVVTLVEASKADEVEAQLKEVSKFTFRTVPKAGASIIRVRA